MARSASPPSAVTTEALASRRTRPTNSRLPRLLLVDDDPAVLRGLSRLLLDQWNVTTAHSANQAALLLDAFRYQAVITDFEMPGHDGLWLLERVRGRHPEIRRLLISGSDPEQLEEHVRSGLVECFLRKPVTRASLTVSLQD
jgi:YesN/AraC family two-component response regulator